MDYGRIVLAVVGISASALVCLRSLRTWQQNRIKMEKSKLVREALELAEERLIRYEERHDRILNHICSQYLINQELLEALSGARDAMEEALEFVVGLRDLELETMSSFPDDGTSFDLVLETRRTQRQN
ncbi:hypothetical protein LIER_20075 [Lithospermum erythrorhizon]|uniref:Uncharacterized protein n=1 Tax=Lithospermum erythrorhizon TaxID=34254 RepID=A0AAV3QN65_LITER